MARAVQVEFEGAFYHVMARGDRREAIVREDADRATFVRALSDASERSGSGSRLRADEQPRPSSVGDSAGESFPRDGMAAEHLHASDQYAAAAFGGILLEAATRRSWWNRETAFGRCWRNRCVFSWRYGRERTCRPGRPYGGRSGPGSPPAAATASLSR